MSCKQHTHTTAASPKLCTPIGLFLAISARTPPRIDEIHAQSTKQQPNPARYRGSRKQTDNKPAPLSSSLPFVAHTNQQKKCSVLPLLLLLVTNTQQKNCLAALKFSCRLLGRVVSCIPPLPPPLSRSHSLTHSHVCPPIAFDFHRTVSRVPRHVWRRAPQSKKLPANEKKKKNAYVAHELKLDAFEQVCMKGSRLAEISTESRGSQASGSPAGLTAFS
ncbi:hypothetical protein DFJ73DRAFT_262279 [Zopfochytrium polystomum]|nr:hypothetical protein DFJ73DRAFT_262279 [Zopfochytrium polystomum]